MSRLSQADLDLVLQHTDGLWNALRNQRLFITGGTGFFGCWLIETFLHANKQLNLDAEAWVLTRSPQAFARKAPHLASDSSINLYRGDVRDFAFPKGNFSHVIHAATPSGSSINRDDPLLMVDIVVQGTRHMLDFALSHGTENFLLTSSGAVYGPQPAALPHVPEDFLGGPDTTHLTSAYAEGKRMAEHLCAIYHHRHGLATKIARCFAFVGPHLPLDAHFAIGNFIRDALRDQPIHIRGDGTPLRSYLYAADLAIWLWTILLRAPASIPFNVGAEQAISIAELAAMIDEMTGRRGVHIAQPHDSSAAPQRYVPCTQRARTQLGLTVHVPLPDAIRRTMRFVANTPSINTPLNFVVKMPDASSLSHGRT